MATPSASRLATAFVLWSFAGLALAQDRLQEGRSLVDWYFFDVGEPEPGPRAGQVFPAPLAAHTSGHLFGPGAASSQRDVLGTKTTASATAAGLAGWARDGAPRRCYLHSLQLWGACAPFGGCAWAQREAAAWRRVEMCAEDESLVCCPEAERRADAEPARPALPEDTLEFPASSPSWDPYTFSYYPPAGGCGHGHHSHHGHQQHAPPPQPPQQGYWGGPPPPPSDLPPRIGATRPAPAAPRPQPQPMVPVKPVSVMPLPQRPMQARPDLVPWIAEDNKLNASEPSVLNQLNTLPFQSTRRPGDLAREKCIAYEKWAPTVRYGPDKDCVPNHSYPIGGNPAVPNEFPHMAHLGVGRQNSIQWFCGGSLIAPKWVLTAAHCLYSGERQVQWVRLGDQEPDTDKEEYNPQIIAVKQIVKHPDYRALQAYNDIGLLRLAREPDMTPPYVRPACLQVNKELKKDKLNLIGFGLTEENGDPAPVLMEVAIYRTPYEKCKRFFEGEVNIRMLPRGLDDNSQLCAGLDQVGKDACQGDSGGPLNTPYSPSCMLYVAGITSFGQGCGRGAPGVYTRVSHFVPWIESVVWAGE